MAVEKAVRDAKRHVINVPLNRGKTFPHRIEGIAGGARVMLRPASEGTGMHPTYQKSSQSLDNPQAQILYTSAFEVVRANVMFFSHSFLQRDVHYIQNQNFSAAMS